MGGAPDLNSKHSTPTAGGEFLKVDEQSKREFLQVGLESVKLGQILVLAKTVRSEKMTMRFHSLHRAIAESPHARRDLPQVGTSLDDVLSASAAPQFAPC